MQQKQDIILDSKSPKSSSEIIEDMYGFINDITRDIHMDYIDMIEITSDNLAEEIKVIGNMDDKDMSGDVKTSVISALNNIRENLYTRTKNVVEKSQ